MTVKNFIVFSSSLFAVATITLIISLFVLGKSEQTIKETQNMSRELLLLSEELRESSRGLTSAVEKFTVTGNERYSNDYNEIVRVRSGKSPRPGDREIAPGVLIPLNELMIEAKCTEQELRLLKTAEELSNDLIIRETQAMNAARGLFKDSGGDYTVKGEPDFELARNLIFNPEYEKEVEKIMAPINEFNELLRVRLNKAVDDAQTNFERSLRAVWVVLFIFVSLFIAFVMMLNRVIIRPILLCDIFAKQIAGGNPDSSLEYESGNEIGSLAASLRAMVQYLLERVNFEEHARYFDAVIAAADAGVVISDKNYLITDWNVGAERILGYTSEDVIGKTARIYTPENNHSAIDALHESLRNGEHIAHMETVRQHKDGRLINCSASYTPIFDDNGDYSGLLGVFHDITDAKIAERQARNLAAIVEIADAGIVINDKNGAVAEWNSGAEKILGYNQGEVVGKTTHYYAPENVHSAIDDVESKLLCGESILRLDVLRKHKNGRLIDCSSSYTPIFDERGEFAGSVAVFHDISDKKRLESELKNALKTAEEKHKIIISGISYAAKIQKTLLPRNKLFEKVFKDYSIVWKPRDIVGGDIYWMKGFEAGAVLCVCDCTGHGTPGALLTMLVVSSFEALISERNCSDTAEIMFLLDRRLSRILNVDASERAEKNYADVNNGCDLAVLFIANDASVYVSAGNTNVFVCNGHDVTQIKGQRLSIGEGAVSRQDVKVTHVRENPENKFYIASDGLFDQIGGEKSRPFGYRTFKKLLIENHADSQMEISKKIWNAFEEYRGDEARRDDVQLITFSTKPRLE